MLYIILYSVYQYASEVFIQNLTPNIDCVH